MSCPVRSARARVALVALLATLASGVGTVSADDTEIFFGQVKRGAGTNPNVLFVLDTSGSMTSTDGTGSTRLQRMKDALHEILDATTGVNVGIMRFQGTAGGSAVIQPITLIDAEICEDDDCDTVTVSARVGADTDDVEERLSDGAIMLGGDDLSLSLDGTDEQMVGLRFPRLVVPQGARIVSAVLELDAKSDSAAGGALTISAEASDDAAPFTAAAADVSSRGGGVSTSWTPSAWTMDETYATDVDLAPLVQSVVDRAGWCGGNALALLIEGPGGEAQAKSFETSPDGAPRLRVEYDPWSVPSEGGCTLGRTVRAIASSSDDAEQRLDDDSMYLNSSDLELPNDGSRDQLVGMRFTDLEIPPSAEITRASIEFTIDEKYTGWSSLYVHAEASDDAAPIGTSARDLSDRVRVAAPRVNWSGMPELDIDETIETPDLAALVQQNVDRTGWSAGNAMLFFVEDNGSSGRRTMESFDGELSSAPTLTVDYRVPSGGGFSPATIVARDVMKEVVTRIGHAGGTPIVDALYEAAQYMRGGPVDYGLTRGVGNKQSTNRVSHIDSWSGGSIDTPSGCAGPDDESSDCVDELIQGSPDYISPMTSSCQTNHIVLLTDGQASSISSAARVRSLIGATSCEAVSNGKEECGRELAAWLNGTDHRDDIASTQNIFTHTIGLELGSGSGFEFIEDLASLGGGSAYFASSSGELVNAFQQIIGEAITVDTAFVAPGATVNQFNRLTHRQDVYFALFKPHTRPRWNGNLKQYRIGGSTDGVRIEDSDGREAVDVGTGFFVEDARSFWSDSVDGAAVELGGAAEELAIGADAPTRRRIFTWLGDSGMIPVGGLPLDLEENRLHEDNTAITLAALGLEGQSGSEAEREQARREVLAWARGIDVRDGDDDGDTSETRGYMGDPMHSRPVIVNYANPDAAADAGPDESVLTTIFLGTNEGLLHGIDRREGREVFSFMPQELLPNIAVLDGNDASETHPYGLDGPLSVWTEDTNNNVMVNVGERAMLYVGMRRGGSNLYALDVSDRDDPRLAWVIEGGPDGTPGFEELGQSWSRAVPTRMMIDGVPRQVLLFGAGYDENQDPDPNQEGALRTTDTVGRGFFVVDALTGERLWAAIGDPDGDFWHTDLDYSVPGDLRVIDVDFDGFADQIWFGDTGGQIWRFDVAPYHRSGALMQGGVVANLSGIDHAGDRRFYSEPDISLIGDGGKRFLSIAIGSGWRAHPLDTDVQDRFYLLRSDAIYGAPEGYGREDNGSWRPLTETDLTNVTDTLEPEVGAYGWYLELEEPGEKVLGDSITVNEQVVFTTYRPEPTLGACETSLGGASVYAINVRDGSPSVDADGDGVRGLDDRDKALAHGGIPPEPTALFTEYGPTVLVGPEQPLDVDFENLTQRSFWRDEGGRRRSDMPVVSLD